MNLHMIGLHGLGGDRTLWAGLAAALGPDIALDGIDLPGFGSAAALGGRDVAGMRDHAAAALAGHAPFVLVGHSMGARIALAVARLAADGDPRLTGLGGLVLLAGSPPAPEPIDPKARRKMLRWFRGAFGARPTRTHRAQARRYVAANVAGALAADLHDAAVAAALRSHPDAWRGWLADGLDEDWRDRIGTLELPALVVAGDEDDALGAQAQAMLMLPHLPRGRLAVLQGAAHLLHLERPAPLAALIAGWMAELAAPASAAGAPAGADRRDYRALVESPRVSANTRAALLARADPPDPAEPISGDASIIPCVRAVCAWALPDADADALARAAIGGGCGDGDGWRFAHLPQDHTAWRAAAIELDWRAGGQLASLPPPARDALLDGIAGEDPAQSTLSAVLADMQSTLVKLFVGQPRVLAALGYSGIAYGGDGPRLPGFTLAQGGAAEDWEPPVRSEWR